MKNRGWRAVLSLLVALVLVLPALAPAAAQDGERISRFGEYEGYSQLVYSEWVRLSQYVEVRDGTRLAVDLFRPAVDGVPVEDPLPVIWTHHRYHRARLRDDGGVRSLIDQVPGLERVLQHGYVIAAVDVRGGGASYGARKGEFTRQESLDAYDITEWLAAQPWSTGKIGMFGISYLGITQYLAASTQPPHLVAIFPQMAMFDLYYFVYTGGVFKEDFVFNWGGKTFLLDRVIDPPSVDDDPLGVQLAEARAEHAGNWNIYMLARQINPYRDAKLNGMDAFVELSPSSYIDAINESGVAIYHLAGWYDMYPEDALLWYNNLDVPQKIVVTPWSHDGEGGFDLVAEHLRWFDYWLKGIDNGIMDEPPIVYDVMTRPGVYDWRTAESWPLPETQYTPFYFVAGPSGSIDSVNDGLLLREAPAAAAGADDYMVDYTTTTGTSNRWANGRGIPFEYPDMRANDAKALTYTTPPLDADMEITGHPIAHLWVSADAEDADFFVYLEEVAPSGYSRYITEGTLRASHRALHDAPWDTFGLPFHRGNEADVLPLPADGTPVELVIALQPTSNVFDAGHRIRITVTGADADTFRTPQLDPPPTVTLHRSADAPSHIILPLIPAP